MERKKLLAQTGLIKNYLITPVFYMLFILGLSLLPVREGKVGGYLLVGPLVSNILHIPLFGLLALLWP